jgi:UDPglucose 6-dehydrogenase
MRITIIGYGHVGKAMHHIFPEAVVYDKPLGVGTLEATYDADIAFVCVPTPMHDHGECDTSIVEEVVASLQAEIIVLRSTVPVGFTDDLRERTGRRIVFQPEYYGETVDHPFSDLSKRAWITLGGLPEDIACVVEAYQQVYNAELKIMTSDAKTAELAKYMENCYLAMKVTFCNEFYEVAESYGIQYHELRELWLADPRIGHSHTFVHKNDRGFGGKCLPKDVSALIAMADKKDVNVDLMKSVRSRNIAFRQGE